MQKYLVAIKKLRRQSYFLITPVYGSLFYVIMYASYKLLKMVRFMVRVLVRRKTDYLHLGLLTFNYCHIVRYSQYVIT